MFWGFEVSGFKVLIFKFLGVSMFQGLRFRFSGPERSGEGRS